VGRQALDLTSCCLQADAPQGADRMVSRVCRGYGGGRGGDLPRLSCGPPASSPV